MRILTRVSFFFLLAASSFFLQWICHKIDMHGTHYSTSIKKFGFLSLKNQLIRARCRQAVCFQNSQEIAWLFGGVVLMGLGGMRKSSLLTPPQIEHNQYGFLIYCSLSKFTHYIDQGVWNALVLLWRSHFHFPHCLPHHLRWKKAEQSLWCATLPLCWPLCT